jgi:carbon storage regulator
MTRRKRVFPIPARYTVIGNMEVRVLVLTRRATETLVLDGDIVLTIVKVDGNKVRIGIQAPGDVSVVRGELSGNSSRPASASRASLRASPRSLRSAGELAPARR